MRKCLAGALLLGALSLVGADLRAHHSFSAEFDAKKPVTLTGTVTRMKWVNPHAWLYIDVKDKKGKVTNWALEFGLPGSLYRRGWRQKDLPVGATVTVTGYLARDGSPTANAATVALPDGRKLFAGSSGTGAPVE
jgi:hypothetical protein